MPYCSEANGRRCEGAEHEHPLADGAHRERRDRRSSRSGRARRARLEGRALGRRRRHAERPRAARPLGRRERRHGQPARLRRPRQPGSGDGLAEFARHAVGDRAGDDDAAARRGTSGASAALGGARSQPRQQVRRGYSDDHAEPHETGPAEQQLGFERARLDDLVDLGASGRAAERGEHLAARARDQPDDADDEGAESEQRDRDGEAAAQGALAAVVLLDGEDARGGQKRALF